MFYINTTQAPSLTQCSPSTLQWITFTGSELINVGVQTDRFQQYFQIVQSYVGGNGTYAGIQVANNGSTTVGWWWSYVQAHADSDAVSAKEMVIDFGEEKLPPKR